MNWRQLEQRTTSNEELQLVQSVSGLSINLSLSLVGRKYNQTFCCRRKELEAFNNWTNCSELNAKQKSAKVNICTTGQLGWWRQSADSVELAWAQLSWAQLVPCYPIPSSAVAGRVLVDAVPDEVPLPVPVVHYANPETPETWFRLRVWAR